MKVLLMVDVPENVINLKRARANVEIIDQEPYECEVSVKRSCVPLRPLPERKEVDEQILDLIWWTGEHYMAYGVGYNSCLDEIGGEPEWQQY